MPDSWYVGKNGNRRGPFTSAQVRQMVATGELKPTDMLWKEGMANWIQASSVTELFAAIQPDDGMPPPPVPGFVSNPYITSAVNPPSIRSTGGPVQYAEFLPRVLAFFLDSLFLGLMSCIPVVGTLVFLVAMGDIGSLEILSGCCGQIMSLLIGVVYYVVQETSPKQGTWGKQIMGIKVTDLQGNRLTIGRAVGRYFAKFITGCTCGIGVVMPLFTEKKQTLHDMIAGCLAINK